MRLREDLAEVRRPLAENSVAALQLSSSVDDIVEAVHPPVEISVGALPLLAALGFIEELLVELRDDMPLMRALGLEHRVAARPRRGRLRSMSQGGRWAIRAAARQGASASTHAAGFSRSHACTRRKAAEEVISLSSCGGSNISIIEKARKRELGIFFFPVPTVYAQQRLSRSGSVSCSRLRQCPSGREL